jgi:hypothetical protein
MRLGSVGIRALPPEVSQRVIDEYEEEEQQHEAIAARVGVASFAKVGNG